LARPAEADRPADAARDPCGDGARRKKEPPHAHRATSEEERSVLAHRQRIRGARKRREEEDDPEKRDEREEGLGLPRKHAEGPDHPEDRAVRADRIEERDRENDRGAEESVDDDAREDEDVNARAERIADDRRDERERHGGTEDRAGDAPRPAERERGERFDEDDRERGSACRTENVGIGERVREHRLERRARDSEKATGPRREEHARQAHEREDLAFRRSPFPSENEEKADGLVSARERYEHRGPERAGAERDRTKESARREKPRRFSHFASSPSPWIRVAIEAMPDAMRGPGRT